MGALTSNRKRGDDSFSIPFDQSYDHFSKKLKLSVPVNRNAPEMVRASSSKSAVSIITQYPDSKRGFSREVRSPVRNSRFESNVSAQSTDSYRNVAEECFVPLTDEEKEDIFCAFSTSNRRKLMIAHPNSFIDITGEKLQCLKPGAWVNDEVINLYFELLKERERREPEKFLKCHFFNTFFYKKLISGRGGYNFQSVRRWTSQKKLGYSLLECDKIFVPIHKEVHWCLAVINKKEKKFQYLDSLGGSDDQVLNVLAKYFVDEVKDKCGDDINVSSWDTEFVTELPKQSNGFDPLDRFDCGVFMIKYADFYSRDIGLCFRQDDMPYFRLMTAREILNSRAD